MASTAPSSDLLWLLVRKNNAFKRSNAAATKQRGVNKLYLTAEKGNLTARSAFKDSGLANHRAVDLQQGESATKGQVVVRELSGAPTKQAISRAYEMERTHLPKMNRVIGKNTSILRPDLEVDALRRLTALYKANRKAKALAK